MISPHSRVKVHEHKIKCKSCHTSEPTKYIKSQQKNVLQIQDYVRIEQKLNKNHEKKFNCKTSVESLVEIAQILCTNPAFKGSYTQRNTI